MPVKSLYRLATEACLTSIKGIEDVGEAPYHVVRPVLLKIENPQQLREIEKASPQICGPDAELWRAFIKRDIQGWQSKNYEPSNQQSWWKVYRRLKREAEEDAREKEEALKAALNKITTEKAQNQLQFVDRNIDPTRKRQKQPTTFARTGNTSLLTFASGSRTKTATGKGMLDKARREARERSLFSAQKSILSTPTHRLAEKSTHGRIMTGPNTMGNVSQLSSTLPQWSGSVGLVGPRTMTGPSTSPRTAPTTAASQASPTPEKRMTIKKRPVASVFLPNKRPKF